LKTLDTLASEIRACKKCLLKKQCKRRIPGSGLPTSRVMFVGQAPGWPEDRQGLPFVGGGGVLMSELIRSVPDLNYHSYYYTYLVKCYPGKQRGGGDKIPPAEAIAACEDWLLQELELVQPELIVALGPVVMRYFGIKGGIEQNSGKIYDLDIGPVLVLMAPNSLFKDKKKISKFRTHLNSIATFLRDPADTPEWGTPPDEETYGLDIETQDDEVWCIGYANDSGREAIQV